MFAFKNESQIAFYHFGSEKICIEVKCDGSFLLSI